MSDIPQHEEEENKPDELTENELDEVSGGGNFEIQRLMSQYNQAETLASNVQKKTNDTQGGVIGKI